MTRFFSAVLLGLLALGMQGTARGQSIDCNFSSTAPALEFGTIPANPTVATTTAGNVSVYCSGASLGNPGTVKACLKLSNGAPDNALLPNRRLANGSGRLSYQVYRDSAHTEVWGDATTAPAGEVLIPLRRTGFFFWEGSATLTLYGAIGAGQAGLTSGNYQSQMSLQLTGDFSSQPCSAIANVLDTDRTVLARATIASSCTVAANDLSFGTHSQLAAAVNASTSLGVTCSVNTPYTVRMDGGTTANNVADRRMGLNGTGPAAQGVAYQLRHTSPNGPLWGDGTSGTSTLAGTGTGGSQTLPVYGRVLPQAVPLPGQYEDTVTVTVQY
ncbi:Csu type fimbrial protein [Novilysobacter selenitireducens]|uniref:Spore coat U domain-containing protein n=1 Tax=Novilysobacter selenitireducens TaxID=2872639 RepID=A0ABS7T219_9GAMM|nr:spore coat U domain-containing protein [Lysobacter selenitireducens]MBZ4037925.1 spore coat U domain-containing protein [Lysobacter selenitireducens]